MKVGDLIIKTHVDNSEVDKKINQLEQQLNKKKLDVEVKTKNVEKTKKQLETIDAKIKETEDKLSEISEMSERFAELEFKFNELGQELTEEEEIERVGLSMSGVAEREQELLSKLENLNDEHTKLESKLESQNQKLENAKNSYDEITNKIKEYNIESKKMNFNTDNIGKSIQKISTKLLRWAGALIGIRSIYMGIRGAMNLIASQDEQFKADLDYIKNSFLSIFEPVARRILDIIKQIMYYVGYIIKAWTGKNIFENANKYLSSANKNANKLKNTLAGFDEMNILSNTSGGDSGGGVAPSIDLTDVDKMKVPSWIDWIAKNGELITSILAGILGYVLLTKLGLKDIKALGIVLLIEGIIGAVRELKAYLDEPTWEHFGKMIEYIGLAIIGLGLIIGGLPVIITGVIIAIVGLIYKHWNEIQAFLQRGINWLKEKGEWIRQKFGNLVGDLYDRFVRNLQLGLNWLGTIMGLIKANFNEIISFINNVFAGNWRGAWQNVKNIFYNIWLGIKATAETIFKQIINGALGILEYGINKPIDKINQLSSAINNIPGINLGKIPRVSLPRLAKGTILNNPGKGVPVASGRAIAGEAGREAYLPLSDEQLLEELGSSIGRHVTINLTNITQMNGRIINRELKRVQNNQDFAFNG